MNWKDEALSSAEWTVFYGDLENILISSLQRLCHFTRVTFENCPSFAIVQTKVQTVLIEMRIQNQVSLAFTVLGNEVLQNSPLFIQDFLSLKMKTMMEKCSLKGVSQEIVFFQFFPSIFLFISTKKLLSTELLHNTSCQFQELS